METLERELSPLVRLRRVHGHLVTPVGSTVNAILVPDGLFEIVLASTSNREYWINSCTWCHDYERRIVESRADAYELKAIMGDVRFLRIPVQLYVFPPTETG